MKTEARGRSIRVGLFLSLSVLLLVVAIFILGRSEALFRHKVQLNTSFANTSGLIVGAPVRLAGLDVGIVQRIGFDKDPKEKRIHVVLSVDSRYLDRIRADSVAHLGGKGLLGDMIVNLSIGDAGAAPLKNGDTIQSEETQGLAEVLDAVREVVAKVKTLATDVDERLKLVLTPGLAGDLGRVVHSAAAVMNRVEKGDGLVHAVVYDNRLGKRVDTILADADKIVLNANRAVVRVEQLLAAVEQGHGTAHALIYGDDGAKAIVALRRAADEIGGLLDEVKTGRGLVHSLIYEEDRTNLLQNLTKMSEILRKLAEDTDAGKGTVGALLKDPTIYEDLKDLLGNVRRNKLLKAIIRYEVQQDRLQKPDKPRRR